MGDVLSNVNYILALKVVGLQFVVAALLALYFLRRSFPDLAGTAALVERFALPVALIVALGASTMTLVHSEYFGLPPCFLCWWQRIFLYPQVALLGIALWRGDSRIADYSIALSAAGLAFSLYHHALQLWPGGHLPCPAQGPSCSQILFLEFGYVTYPWMAAVVFALLIALMLFVRKRAE